MKEHPVTPRWSPAGDGGGSTPLVTLTEEYPFVEGILLGIRQSSRYPESLLYDFAVMGDGPPRITLTGSAVLRRRVTEVGAAYQVRYVGLQTGRGGRRYKDFEVMTIPADVVGRQKLYSRYGVSDDEYAGLVLGGSSPAPADDLPF